MTKDRILKEIRRTAAANGGAALGMGTFAKQTGIGKAEWFGVHWGSWGDAVREAGLQPNAPPDRIGEDEIAERYAQLTRDLGRAPSKGDVLLRKRQDSTFPSEATLLKRFGSYANLKIHTRGWCADRPEFAEVMVILAPPAQSARRAPNAPDAIEDCGFVYLVKHGARAEYKIGRTTNPVRREGELRLQLPERLNPLHYIETDDPAGVEAYWHSRFAAKRKEGEWFGLTADDVRAFKKWKKIS